MRPNPKFWNDRTVAVVGGTGFLGRHLVHALHGLGTRVRVLGLPPRESSAIQALAGAELFLGDVRDRDLVRRAVSNCSLVFNVAGPVAATGADLETVHGEAIRGVLETSRKTARIVHTSSIVTIGATRDGRLLDEESPFDESLDNIAYVRAKRASEHLALSAATAGSPVVVVNPGYLLGPEDHEQSFMGRMCLRFWHGRIPAAPPGGFNVVDVRDAARGHLLAAEHGQVGRRYILGGENVALVEFLRRLAAESGCRPRWLPALPGPVLFAVALLAEARAWIKKKPAYPSLAEAKLGRLFCYVSSHRAVTELGYRTRPLEDSLDACHRWHEQRGLIHPRGLQRWWLRPKAA